MFGFTVLWLEFAGLVVIATVVMAALLREPKRDTAQQRAEDVAPVAAKPCYRELFIRDTILFFVGLTAFNLCILAVIAFMPTILQMRGIESTMSGFISTLPMLIALVSCPLIGMLADRVGSPKALLAAGMAFFGPCVFLVYTQTGVLMWAAAIIMGIMALGTAGLILSLYTRILPRLELAPIAMGVSVSIQGIGQFLGTFLVQLLLGPEFLNVALAGVVVMLIGLAGAASFGFCRMRR